MQQSENSSFHHQLTHRSQQFKQTINKVMSQPYATQSNLKWTEGWKTGQLKYQTFNFSHKSIKKKNCIILLIPRQKLTASIMWIWLQNEMYPIKMRCVGVAMTSQCARGHMTLWHHASAVSDYKTHSSWTRRDGKRWTASALQNTTHSGFTTVQLSLIKDRKQKQASSGKHLSVRTQTPTQV